MRRGGEEGMRRRGEEERRGGGEEERRRGGAAWIRRARCTDNHVCRGEVERLPLALDGGRRRDSSSHILWQRADDSCDDDR